MSDTNVFGGKKQRKVTSKKDKDGGAAIEIGSILAPAVLYGLRRMVDAKAASSPRSRSRSTRSKRGGGIFSSVPAPLDGGESIGDWAAASFAKSEPVGVVPATVAKPVEAGPAVPAGGAKPMDGGKRRKAVRKGGNKDQDDDMPMYGGEYGLVEGGKKKVRKAKKGGDKDQDDDGPMYGGEYGLVEGGKRRKAKKGGDKDQDDDMPMEGGKKKRAAKKGGDKDQDGGKKRKAKAQKGGAMQLFQDQLIAINDRIGALLGDRK